MSKYVFCDLDYTLLDNNKKILKADYEAIKKFESKGNHFIICSGRVPFALKQYKDFLGSSDVIASNGALIISDNKIIKNRPLSKEAIKLVTDYGIKNKACVRYFTNDLFILLNKEAAPKCGFDYAVHEYADKNNIYEIIEDKEIIKVSFTSDDKQVLRDAETYVKNTGIDVEITYSSDIFLEINCANQNKGLGIIDYCKLKNIDIKDTIAIGDNDNDLTMLKAAYYSACPSNAIDLVKESVNYVCKNDNNHNAVKEVLENIQ